MNLLQRNDNWTDERLGKITASRIKDLSAKPQKGKALNAVMLQLLSERLTGQKPEEFTTKAMQWGVDNEPLAITAYEIYNDCFVVGTGLIDHPTIPMSGASPDGLVGKDGQIEIKCPDTTTHLNTILNGVIPPEHLPQITWQLACTGREWCDFVSFDPRLKGDLSLFVRRVYACDLDIAGLEKMVIDCNEQLDEIIANLTGEVECA